MQHQNQKLSPDTTTSLDDDGEPVKFTCEGGDILFWSGLYDGSGTGLLATHRSLILEKMRTFDRKKSSQIPGVNFYGMWLNSNIDRLIFCDYTVDGKNILILLEHITGHHYDYSMLDKSQKFKAKLEVLKKDIHAELQEREIASHLPKKVKLKKDEKWQSLILRNNDKVISLDDEQDKGSLQQSPLIIFGMPGSGKSMVLNTNMANEVKRTEDDDKKIVVTTESEKLLDELRKGWHRLPEYQGHEDSVIYINRKNLNNLWFPDDEWEEVGEDNFKEWYKRYLSHLNNIEKSGKHDTSEETEFRFLANPSNYNNIYQELTHIAPLSLEEYKNLGAKLCHYADPKKREYLWKVASEYKKYLAEERTVNDNKGEETGKRKRKGKNVQGKQTAIKKSRKYFHPAFSIIPESKRNQFKGFRCDEAHNCFLQELINMALAANLNVVYVLDNLQDFTSIYSKRPQVEMVIEKYLREEDKGRAITTRILRKDYRKGKNALPMTNRVLFINAIFSDAEDRCGYKAIQGIDREDGDIFWMLSSDGSIDADRKSLDFLHRVKNLASFAIFADEKYHAEIKQIFGEHVVVMTVEMSKGLEFEYVLAYKPCEGEVYRKLGTEVKKIDFEKSVKENKSQVNENNISIEMVLAGRRTLVALTRHEKYLFIYQPLGKQAGAYLESLYAMRSKADLHEEIIQPSTDTEWDELIIKLIPVNYDLAKKQWLKIGRNAEDFGNFVQKNKNPEVAPTITTTTTSTNAAPAAEKTVVPERPSPSNRGRGRGDSPIPRVIPGRPAPVSNPAPAAVSQPSRSTETSSRGRGGRRGRGRGQQVMQVSASPLQAKPQLSSQPTVASKILTKKLLVAARDGQINVVKKLLKEGANVNDSSETGATAILVASEKGNLKLVKFLIDNGANLGAVGTNGTTPLMFVAQHGDLELVKCMVDKGANVDAVAKKMNKNGEIIEGHENALTFAIRHRHSDIAQYLIQKENSNTNDTRPLHLACAQGMPAIVRQLLQPGSKYKMDIDKKFCSGTPTDFACNPKMACEQDRFEIIKELLEQGTRVDDIDCDENTTLLKICALPCEKNTKDLIELLLAKGTSLTHKNKKGQTALDIAKQMNNDAVIEILKAKETSIAVNPAVPAEATEIKEAGDEQVIEEASAPEQKLQQLQQQVDEQVALEVKLRQELMQFQSSRQGNDTEAKETSGLRYSGGK